MRTLAVWVLICAAAAGQQRGALSEAEAVVVGGLTGGTSADLVSKVQVSTQLVVKRVLKGEIAAGAQIPMSWEYHARPYEGPSETTKAPQGYGLWALKRSGGKWQPLPIALMGWVPLGGTYLPMPDGEPTAEYAAGLNANGDERVAAQLAWSLSVQAAQLGNRLQGTGKSLDKEQTVFERTANLLSGVPLEASAGAYRKLLASPVPDLRAVAIAGLLRSADSSALAALERDAVFFSKSITAGRISYSVSTMNLREHPEALLPLARVATGETEIPSLDANVARHLEYSKRVEALPYLGVMLESWNSSTRVAAVMGFCSMVQPGGPLTRLWNPQMSAQCPTRTPLRDEASESAVVEYWKNWWASEREVIAALGPLPQVQVPARYRSAPSPQLVESAAVPLEQIFHGIVSMTVSMVKSGDLIHVTPLGDRVSKEDEQTLKRISLETDQRLQQDFAALVRMMDEARAAGRKPSQEQTEAYNVQMQGVLREALDQARRELSGAGWRELEKQMAEEMSSQGSRIN